MQAQTGSQRPGTGRNTIRAVVVPVTHVIQPLLPLLILLIKKRTRLGFKFWLMMHTKLSLLRTVRSSCTYASHIHTLWEIAWSTKFYFLSFLFCQSRCLPPSFSFAPFIPPFALYVARRLSFYISTHCLCLSRFISRTHTLVLQWCSISILTHIICECAGLVDVSAIKRRVERNACVKKGCVRFAA